MRITNVDTLSALIDRMISENIKLFFFRKDGLGDKVKHQEMVIAELRSRIKKLFIEVFTDGEYQYMSELRTYKLDSVMESMDELIKADLYTGEGDRNNLAEAVKDEPDVRLFAKNHKLLRKSNEMRAHSKNKLDEQFKGFIEEL